MTHAQRLSTGRGPVATNVEHEMDMTEQYHPSINRIFFSFTHAGRKKRVASLTPNRKTWHIHYESRTDTTSSRLDALTARTQVSTKYQTHSLIHGILALKVPHSSPVGRVSSTAAAPSISFLTSDFESRSISKICLDVVPFGWHVRKMIVEKSSVNDCQQLSWRPLMRYGLEWHYLSVCVSTELQWRAREPPSNLNLVAFLVHSRHPCHHLRSCCVQYRLETLSRYYLFSSHGFRQSLKTK